MTEVPLDPPRHLVREAVARAIAEDLGPLGDVTAALVDPAARTVADVVVRADGVLAGTACATEVFAQIDPTLEVTWRAGDGTIVAEKTVVGTVAGALRSVLTAERSALNFLCHLSGRGHRDAPFRGGARGACARRRDAQDPARPPGTGEGRGARRRRREPSRIALRPGAGEGQPPGRPRDLGGGHARTRAVAGPRCRGGV